MRIQDIIRDFLNIVDQAEQPEIVVIQHDKTGQQSPFTHTGKEDDIRRFKQIVDLADNGNKEYVNSPNEQYADIEVVTTGAGGGVNGPKHPRDLRGNSFPIYPENE